MTTYYADKKDPWHYIWIGFGCRLELGELFAKDVITAPDCAHIFEDLAASEKLETGREWYVCAKTYELLARLRHREAPAQDRTLSYVRMAQNYIEAKYMDELRVSQLAAYLGLDRSYFSKIFKQHTGKSPQDYIVDFRLKKAAELMVTRDLGPGEAARLTGYADIVSFSRIFRKKYGVAPSHYGKNKGQGGKK